MVTIAYAPRFPAPATDTSTILVVLACLAQISRRNRRNVRSHSSLCTAFSSASMSRNVRARTTLMPPNTSGSWACVSSLSAADSGGRAASDSRMGHSAICSSRRSKSCMLSCSPLVTGRSHGWMTSRAFAFAWAWPMSNRS
jgi:hypothetical protein